MSEDEAIAAFKAALADRFKRFGPFKGLAEAVREVIAIIRGAQADGPDGLDNWDRIVSTVAEHESLPNDRIKDIETAIARVSGGWSDSQRRAIWHETESGQDCDCDESPCDASLDGVGRALQIELLDEVTRTAWLEAKKLKKSGKRGGGL